MISGSIRNTKGAVLLSAILAMGLTLAGCGGSGDDSRTPMSSTMDPPTAGPNEMTDLGEWTVVRENGLATGYEHAGHGLTAKFDATGGNPTITDSSPMHQPTVAGTWSGRWIARYTALTSEPGTLDETDDGTATIGVTIAGGDVEAVLTYSGIDVPGLPSSMSSAPASVTDGRFAPSGTVSIPTGSGSVSRTFRGLGQFGGTDQAGVVGYVTDGDEDFRSTFYGERR